MCFSAMASFTGGAVLTAIGAVAVYQNKEPDRRLFAAIPFIFGLQQASEGFVWKALETPGHESVLKLATYIFLFAAVVIWPTLVPLSVLLMEKQKKRRIFLYIFLAAGVAVSIAHGAGLLLYQVTAQIDSYHILYTMDSPYWLASAVSAAYLIATIPPLLASSHKRVRLFGSIILISYMVTFIFYREYLVSVWCFFAALASAVIWWIASNRTPAAKAFVKTDAA